MTINHSGLLFWATLYVNQSDVIHSFIHSFA